MNTKTQTLILAASVLTIGMNAQSYTGKYSSEGDITAKGMMTMELTQNKAKLEGIANYKANSGDLDTGILSVNGYTKDGIGFIRLRDQKGNTLADAEIHFQGKTTIHLTQTSSNNNGIPRSVYLYNTSAPVQIPSLSIPKGELSGRFSSEGDVTAPGILSMDLQQQGAKIEGTANYSSKDGAVATGIISVNGYAKGGVGYIRFRDSNANVLGDGTLKKSGSSWFFNQTTTSQWLPKSAYLYK